MDNLLLTKNAKDDAQQAGWYDAEVSDPFVTYVASMLECMRKSEANTGENWLKRVVQKQDREKWSYRRRFWLATANLRYAEMEGDKQLALDIIDFSANVRKVNTDFLTCKMYEALEADCFTALYRITEGSIRPFFKHFHKNLLVTIDDFMDSDDVDLNPAAYLDDTNHLFALASSIEEIMASAFHKNVPNEFDEHIETATVVPFSIPANQRIIDILDYLRSWEGTNYDKQSYEEMQNLLAHVENAKQIVEKKLGFTSESLFQQNAGKDLAKTIAYAKREMISELESLNITLPGFSFWKLYLESVVLTCIQNMGEQTALSKDTIHLLRQAARWPLHEKMLRIVKSLASRNGQFKAVMDKRIINSDSLLYGIFARLSMKNIDVLYCGFAISWDDKQRPVFNRHCHNGKGEARLYRRWVDMLFRATHDQIDYGYCLDFAKGTGFDSQPISYACVCTGKQMIIIGLPEQFSLDDVYEHNGREVLAELMEFSGFRFNHFETLQMIGPKTPETSATRYKTIRQKEAFISGDSQFLHYLSANESTSDDIDVIINFEENNLSQGYFEEMMSEVREDQSLYY